MRNSPSETITSKGVGAKPWIKVRTDLWDDPRVSALCEKLKTTEATVIGGLVRLWSIADSHSVNGELPGLSGDAIDRKASIPGFATALVDVGWLVVGEGRVTIPDFSVHNGQSAKSRGQAALRQQSCRARAIESDRVAPPSDVTPPSRKQRDANVTRVEKSGRDQTKPPSPQTNASNAPPNDEWEAVEAELCDLEVADVSGTIQLARDKGYPPETVLSLVAYFRANSGKWEPAAIVWRIGHSPSARPVDQGWPKAREVPSSTSRDNPHLESHYLTRLEKLSPAKFRDLAERAEVPADDLVDYFCQASPKLRRLLAEQLARDDVTSNRAPTAQPPPADSSDQKQKRTPRS